MSLAHFAPRFPSTRTLESALVNNKNADTNWAKRSSEPNLTVNKNLLYNALLI